MSQQPGEDPFDHWFRVFSTEHSWYKHGREETYWLVPGPDSSRPWTWHSWHGASALPLAVQSILQSHRISVGGIVYCQHGRGHGLCHILGTGGWPLLDTWEQRGYKEAVALLRANCRDNAAANDSRYKIDFYQRDLKPTSGPVGTMIRQEYERMRELARDGFYRVLAELYPWIRANRSTAMLNLRVIATQYLAHVDQITADLDPWLPPELGRIVVEYHHVC